jgi:hypothetical protein
MTGDLSFGDNDKAIFGASTNLEIYANGGYSYIDEVGLNNLNIRTNGANIGIYDTANSQYMAKFTTGGDAELYHNGSEKLATTSTGINVTGTVTADGLTVDGNATITTADNSTNLSLVSTDADASVGPVLDLYRNSASPADNDVTGRIIFSAENDADEKIEYQRIITYMPDVSDGSEDGAFQHYIMKDGTRIQRLEHSPTESVFNQDSADVDFRVESNGNANMLFVDGGNDRVGIGTSSPSVSLTTLAGTANTAIARFSGSEGARGLVIETASTTRDDDTVVFNASDAFGRISFETNSTQRMTIDTSGNVTASNSVGVSGNAGMPVLQQAAGSASFPSYSFYDDGNTGMFRPSADALAFATGGSEVVRLSGGNLLVGLSAVEAVGTSAGTQLRADGLVYAAATSDAHILSRRSTDGSILNFRKDTTTVGSIASVGGLIQFGQGNANLKFSNASDVITPANGSGTDNNNAIDLGSSSAAFKSLYLSGTIGADSSTAFTSMDGRLMFDNDYSSSALGPNKVVLQAEGNWVGGLGVSNNFLDIYTGGGIRFNKSASQTSYSAPMTLDASGNLLHGKTVQSIGTVGVTLVNGQITATADGADAIRLNRKSSDGSIIDLRKDGSTVGSIASVGGLIQFGQGNANLKLSNAADAITPANGSGTDNDNALDLGSSSARFDDIHATNGTIQTSDRNEKQDIEELTDAEQRVAVAAKGLLRKFRWRDAVTEKGDEARTHFGIIAQDLQAAFAAEGLDASDYAMFISTTWWETQTEVAAVEAVEAQDAVYNEDGELVTEAVEAVEAKEAYTRIDTYNSEEEAPEGATEKTRMGVRYSELLAFIIAAI